MSRFGTPKEPELEAISELLEGRITTNIMSLFGEGVNVVEFKPLAFTPTKNYTAITSLKLDIGNGELKDLHVLSFAPGDGTGNDTYLRRWSRTRIPEEYIFEENPSRVGPRHKKGIHVEVCMPFFSIVGDRVISNVMSLDLLTVKHEGMHRILIKDFTLGYDLEDYNKYLDEGGDTKGARMFITTGYTRLGDRFGDPHAVISRRDGPNALQVVGFYAVKNKKDPLINVIDKNALVSF